MASCSPLDSSYLPKFGDELCFMFYSGRRDTIEVIMEVSTFEGMAMNAAVPAGNDTISDMVPLDTSSAAGWQVRQRWYAGDRSYFKLRKAIGSPSSPNGTAGDSTSIKLRIKVLDYAAELELSAYPVSDSSSNFGSGIRLPFIVDSLRSYADADSDGLTHWEEYRGFLLGDSGNTFHKRLTDSLVSDLNQQTLIGTNHFDIFVTNRIDSDDLPIDWDEILCLKTGIDTLISYSGGVREGRYVDYMSRQRNSADSSWGLNSLCAIVRDSTSTPFYFPNHTPSNDSAWHFGAITIIDTTLPGNSSDGYVFGFADIIIDQGWTYDGGDNDIMDEWIPGSGSVRNIQISFTNIDNMILDWQRPDSLLGRCLYDDGSWIEAFRGYVAIQSVCHEFGHIFGLEHFNPPWQSPSNSICLMTQVLHTSYDNLPDCFSGHSWGDFLQSELDPNDYTYEHARGLPLIYRINSRAN